MDGLKFNWLYLVIAVVLIAAIVQSGGRWGKWIFGIAIISALFAGRRAMVPGG